MRGESHEQKLAPSARGDLVRAEAAHGWAESLPKLGGFWQYNQTVVAPLSEVLALLQRLAPLELAESWDNVGLLLEPIRLTEAAPLSAALLTIELTPEVLSEALALGARLIVAYHPPIFQGLKRLRTSDPAQRALIGAIADGVAVYSPHTALDAAPDGVNDWLLDAFGAGERTPCLPHPLDPRSGAGRAVRLTTPLKLSEAVARLKRHLGLAQLRVSAAPAHADDAAPIESVAVCAGAGGSLFEKLAAYDLFVTGEMRYHDVRARALGGSSVLLSEHTHTERGFLPILAKRLSLELHDRVAFHVSQCDREPLVFV